MRSLCRSLLALTFTTVFVACQTLGRQEDPMVSLLKAMTLEEKIGQLSMRNAGDSLGYWIADGKVGAILNEVDTAKLARYQQIARDSSRLGIPLLTARDVIHGYRTIFPVPLGQAAAWNPALVEIGAQVAAVEAASQGINWTFAPMLDVSRDPRWGRVVESFGEDAYLGSLLSKAMVKGFQGNDLSLPHTIAACAKHYLAYGWAEGGRDYNTANVGLPTIHDHILPPFVSAIDAGAATVMTAFQDLNGIPATGHPYWVGDYLRHDLGFNGVVVSDWESIPQMVTHGYAANNVESAANAAKATVDMEMQSTTYADHLAALVENGRVPLAVIDSAVLRILRLKESLGLFADTQRKTSFPALLAPDHLLAAQEMATESFILLENKRSRLPINTSLSVAVIGPLADAPHEQLGTWVFDGQAADAVTPLSAIKATWPADKVRYSPGLRISRDQSKAGFAKAVAAAQSADVALLFLGEESIITGESHSRADIRLPGAQEDLVHAIAATGTPIVAVVLAGRPLTMEGWVDKVDALFFGFHPGTMTGPAIVDLLTGAENPSGKLPITFPKHVGQIPIYYNHTNTGKPATPQSFVSIQDIPVKALQTSVGNTSHYLDYGYQPAYTFGYGLSYTTFAYSALTLRDTLLGMQDSLTVTVEVENTGDRAGQTTAQLYIKDHVGSRVRPVRSLQGFQKIALAPGEKQELTFQLPVQQLSFYTAENKVAVEPGQFTLYIGEDAGASLHQSFTVK